MMDENLYFDEMPGVICLWCAAGMEDAELAYAAENAAENDFPIVSVVPGAVARMWAWLEKMPAKIMARFYLTPNPDDAAVSDLVGRVNQSFKNGADGAQIFVALRDLDRFADILSPIRNDLFFNKDLVVGLDINEIGPDAWAGIFAVLKKIGAAGLLLVMPRDSGDESDFVGRVYSMLDGGIAAFGGGVHFMLKDSPARMEQAWRLIRAMRPEMAPRVRFFVTA